MSKLEILKHEGVFHYFEELSSIHRGSGDMEAISQYCIDFAKSHGFKYYTDSERNVVIYKDGTLGLENAKPVILQGHLDIVCQKTPDCKIDFLKDGLDIYVDGDYIKARGTTLGADNGIAVAMVLAILDSNDLRHPPIEAVFTTDEETGMYGAKGLDMSVLSGRRMINLDSEEDDCITVSCAGGCDFRVAQKLSTSIATGTKVTINIEKLTGGHSGVEIHKGRANANIVAGKLLNNLNRRTDFDIISICGGDKANAIPNACVIELCVSDYDAFCKELNATIELIKLEYLDREKKMLITVDKGECAQFDVIDKDDLKKFICALSCTPNGVMEMSATINGLVETSLNLGILSFKDGELIMHYGLRSNKQLALDSLSEKMMTFFDALSFDFECFGHYPPWEYRADSQLRELYKGTYIEQFDKEPRVEALHAGLECGVFASAIDGFDCIAIGPTIYDVHTVKERLSITSAVKIYGTLVKLLAKLK